MACKENKKNQLFPLPTLYGFLSVNAMNLEKFKTFGKFLWVN